MPNNLFTEYEDFVEKFKPKKTTDDCYTPPAVYDCVLDYVDRHVTPLVGRRVLRPFKPCGDYEAEDYQAGDIVIDNPPFSILSKIVEFYHHRDVDFFLFAPALQLCASVVRKKWKRGRSVTAVVVGAPITYANGANVQTSFLTNVWPGSPALAVCGSLNKALKAAQAAVAEDKTMRRIDYPVHVVSAARLDKIAGRGIDWELPRDETWPISKLNCGQYIYGAGYLISDRLVAEKVAAERLAAERLAAEQLAKEKEAARTRTFYPLDESERQLIALISKNAPAPNLEQFDKYRVAQPSEQLTNSTTQQLQNSKKNEK